METDISLTVLASMIIMFFDGIKLALDLPPNEGGISHDHVYRQEIH